MIFQPRHPQAYRTSIDIQSGQPVNWLDIDNYNKLCIALNSQVFHLYHSQVRSIGERRAVQGWSVNKICRVYGLRRNPQHNLPKIDKNTPARRAYRDQSSDSRYSIEKEFPNGLVIS